MKKILSEKQVRELFKTKGYTVVNYINTNNKIDVICPNNHNTSMMYFDFKQGHECSICKNNVKYEYSYVKEYINSNNYTLISKTYESTNIPLNVICPNGHAWNVSFKRFKNGVRCKYCYGNNKKTQKEVEQYVLSKGHKLLSQYSTAFEKIKLQCPKGHTFLMRYNNFQQKQRCPVCNGRIKFELEYIKNKIENVIGYKLLSTEYKNALTKIELQCPKGHTFLMRWNDFNNGQRCPKCSYIDKKSKAEKFIINYIKTIYDGNIIEGDRSLIINPNTGKYLELDIYLPDIKKAIEYNGEYWHSKDNVKKRDIIKLTYCKDNNIKLLVINEREWLTNKKKHLSNIKNFILH